MNQDFASRPVDQLNEAIGKLHSQISAFESLATLLDPVVYKDMSQVLIPIVL